MKNIKPFEWRELDEHRPCTVQLCSNPSSDRYRVPFCQEHILYLWSLVEQDMKHKGITVDDYERDQDEQARTRAQRAADAVPGFIYYLQVGEYLKIGFTTDLQRRVREYPPSARLLARHHGTQDDEKSLHAHFAAFRASGREWYLDVPEIRAHIGTVDEQHPLGHSQTTERPRRDDSTGPRLRTKTSRGARSVL